MVELNFDPNAHQPRESFDVLPPDNYPVVITESAMEPTKSGGGMLKLTMEIIDGQYKGRKLWDRLNLVNGNAQAVDIANRTLTSICHAVGVFKQIKNSEELHNKPMVVKVTVKKDEGYEAKNEVKEYKAYGNASTAAAPQASAPAGQSVQPPFATQAAAAPAASVSPTAGAKPSWAQ